MAVQDELREWLGLASADLPVWCAGICIIVMYILHQPLIDWIMAVIAFILTIAACFMGMKPDDRLSGFSNRLKKISYPLAVVGVIFAAYINFTRWN